MTSNRQDRMNELSNRFNQLESQIIESPEKEAISVLHAMIQESRREMLSNSDDSTQTSERSFEKISNLYKNAPGMEGPAENKGLPVGTQAPDFTLPDADAKQVSHVFFLIS